MIKKIFLLILILGIVLRFFIQFIYPAFNVDEISLGNNIKHLDFIDLLYPLQFGQSSPPLFLWLEKLMVMILPFEFWINIKVLSFFSSVFALVLFYIFIEKYNFKIVFVLLFIIFTFNPFNISNSLTVKQYTMDLTGVMFLIVFFKDNWFKRFRGLFFMFWCLVSNIGLFACAGYLIFNYVSHDRRYQLTFLGDYLKKNIYVLLAPVPYLVYFVWFMKQSGATELKSYMVNYWSDSFMPMDNTIFKYLLYTVHGLWIFLLNSFEFFGIFLFILMLPFFVVVFKKELLFKKELGLLFCCLLVHIGLNVLHLYPFSDRLYLYLSPLFLLVLGSSLEFLVQHYRIKIRYHLVVVFISAVSLFSYALYLPANDNDIVYLNKKIKILDTKSVYATKKVINCVETFNEFTDNEFKIDKDFILLDNSLDKSKVVVSRVAKKIKRNVSSSEEIEIITLLKSGKIVLVDNVNGYNIYKVVSL